MSCISIISADILLVVTGIIILSVMSSTLYVFLLVAAFFVCSLWNSWVMETSGVMEFPNGLSHIPYFTQNSSSFQHGHLLRVVAFKSPDRGFSNCIYGFVSSFVIASLADAFFYCKTSCS